MICDAYVEIICLKLWQNKLIAILVDKHKNEMTTNKTKVSHVRNYILMTDVHICKHLSLHILPFLLSWFLNILLSFTCKFHN